MSLRDLFRRAKITPTCTRCAAAIADGDRFAVVGIMSRRARSITIARSDIHLRDFGRLLCRTCALLEVSDPPC
jgi:hypothetical protein